MERAENLRKILNKEYSSKKIYFQDESSLKDDLKDIMKLQK